MKNIYFFNTLSRTKEQFIPLKENEVTVYSCGPTVYDHAHIGNLSAFIMADTVGRTLRANGYNVRHVMNFTDVDDKTITRSAKEYPDKEPMEALRSLTEHYGRLFIKDIEAIGIDTQAIAFIKATDDAVIKDMQRLVTELLAAGIAYAAEDGIYFSIDAYRARGKTYGLLSHIEVAQTSVARIDNDEYDKIAAADFSLWKTKKAGEPAWQFDVNDKDYSGRPGWHIECSVMSSMTLGQPFDIHTGGIDLIFPHHENEIAQSTALRDDSAYARVFMHNEHILVDGKKMSKSLHNFYTLEDLIAKDVDPLAFRLLVLQSHYRRQMHFSWDNIEAARNRLAHWRAIACLRWQTANRAASDTDESRNIEQARHDLLDALNDDLDTPRALKGIDDAMRLIEGRFISTSEKTQFEALLALIDEALGLHILHSTPDLSEDTKKLIREREEARAAKDWTQSDTIRDELHADGVGLLDTVTGAVWYRL